MPLHDWQFWVVSVAALWGAWAMTRQLLPLKRKGRGKRTQLTIKRSG
jgi:hypothetical protein